MDHAFATLRNLPPHLQPHRFWIWLQIVILTFHVRHIRRDARAMLVRISPRGAVDIVAVGDVPGTARPDPLAFEPSKAFLMAMGEADAVMPMGERLRPARTLPARLRLCATDTLLPRPDT
ncbi:hypothetical protein [Hyphomonas sp.]|uniref:hypothetical protein n=1 Tax=Hyphomonas sp. TaxID=87 RepID=UPI0030018EEC